MALSESLKNSGYMNKLKCSVGLLCGQLTSILVGIHLCMSSHEDKTFILWLLSVFSFEIDSLNPNLIGSARLK